ncbi:MAG: hypothetical protein BWY74_03221 [Firmicutes bacterium ADurb.Bin419]|nr:MAG: hypothetical protein BWY74_03221 [Firmicutes bacterium ADurb.Bin419]
MAQRKSETIWKQTIADCKASGLSARQWCEKNNIKISTYKYWITRLNKQKNSATDICWAEMKIPKEMIGHTASPSITIKYDNFVLDIHENTDLQLLAAVLKTLRSTC